MAHDAAGEVSCRSYVIVVLADEGILVPVRRLFLRCLSALPRPKDVMTHRALAHTSQHFERVVAIGRIVAALVRIEGASAGRLGLLPPPALLRSRQMGREWLARSLLLLPSLLRRCSLRRAGRLRSSLARYLYWY